MLVYCFDDLKCYINANYYSFSFMMRKIIFPSNRLLTSDLLSFIFVSRQTSFIRENNTKVIVLESNSNFTCFCLWNSWRMITEMSFAIYTFFVFLSQSLSASCVSFSSPAQSEVDQDMTIQFWTLPRGFNNSIAF